MINLLAMTALAIGLQPYNIQDAVQKDFRDATFRARVVKANQKELGKINDDFGTSYRFKYTDVKMKEPFKLRLDSSIDDTDVAVIINGPKRVFKIPRAKLVDKQDLSKEPGKRQTALDFGVLTPSLFKELFEAKFVRVDRATKDLVFDITYPANLDDTSRHRVWIDPDKRYVTKREWYGQSGHQRATFEYTEPKNVNGIWIPTRVIVKNADNKVGAETKYERISINSGISDSQFDVG